MLRPRVSRFALPDFAPWKRRARAPIARAEWVLFRRLMLRMQSRTLGELAARRAEIMAEFTHVERELNIGWLIDIEKKDPRRSEPWFKVRLQEYVLLHTELRTTQNELSIRRRYGSFEGDVNYSDKLQQEREKQSREQGTYREDTITQRQFWNHIEEICADLEENGQSQLAKQYRDWVRSRQEEDTRTVAPS